MIKVFGLAMKNLMRYKRRTLLTGMLIAVGVAAVIVFVGLSGSFKRAIVGQITDSVLSHLQVHRKGYMASIDNLPLDRMLPQKAVNKLSAILNQTDGVAAFSPRIKFGAMLSNYAQTTNVRLNCIDPAKERAVVPLLATRVKDGIAELSGSYRTGIARAYLLTHHEYAATYETDEWRRSSRAVVIFLSPKTLDHFPKFRLVVIITDVLS